ncbi:MAG TPA: branched-chain amino acid ABC transporter substrate-binding protein [Hyphomonadaceae bacterium]|nr:branched-chain amino acid ABC transporter substrate-binding protein [Hyphomonadaceae bacterium]
MNRLASLLMGAAALAVATGSAAKADIVVGLAGPMTGGIAAFGEQLKRGGEKAVEDINAKGGVLGQKLKIEIGDDACDPKQAVSVANDLVSKKAAVVIGHFCSGSSIPASSVYSEANVVEISPASTNPQYTERGLKNVFRVCGRDDAQGPTMADYIIDHFKGKVVAIVDDKQTYSKGLADAFKAELNKKGVKEVLYDEITQGEKDYSALVTKLKQAKVDVLFYGGYQPEAALIARQAKEQGMKLTVAGGDALNDPEFNAIAGPAGDGTLFTFNPDATKDPANAALVKWFQDQKYEPAGYTLYAYAALQAWAEAVTKAKSTDGTKVEEALRANKFNTTLGTIGFDAKGDVIAPGFLVYEYNGGKYAYAPK